MNRQYYRGLAFKPTGFFCTAVTILWAVFLLASCAPTKNGYYFKTLQKDTTLSGLVNKDLESKIGKGDNLGITISSLSAEEDILYNKGSIAGATAAVSSASGGFLVNKEGYIAIHKLGLVMAEGFTRKELAANLHKQLLPYLKDPIVTVQYLNHKITVMGEVTNPQVINMPEEQMSLIDAIVLSGDVKENARRDNILIIREVGNEKKIKHVNLEDHSIFSSPWYYVQPNDIVFVAPDFEKKDRDEKRARFQTNFAIITSTISLLIIILDRVLR